MESAASRGSVMREDATGQERLARRRLMVEQLADLMQAGSLRDVELKLAEIMGYGDSLGLSALQKLYPLTEHNPRTEVRTAVEGWISKARGRDDLEQMRHSPEYVRMVEGKGVIAEMIDDIIA